MTEYRSPDRLETEVEKKRADVEQTLDALQAKMSLGQLIDELSNHSSSQGLKQMAANAATQARDNPLALGLIGAGLAWLAAGDGVKSAAHDAKEAVRNRTGSAEDRDDHLYESGYFDEDLYESDFDDDAMLHERGLSTYDPYLGEAAYSQTAGEPVDDDDGRSPVDRAKDAATAARDGVSSAAGKVGDGASAAASDAQARARAARRAMQEQSEEVREALSRRRARAMAAAERARIRAGQEGRKLQQGFLTQLDEQPLVMGALAMAVGTAIGAALPQTQVENELLGEHADRLRARGADAASNIARSAGDAAERAYEAGRAQAEAEGLTHDPTSEKPLADRVDSVVRTAVDAATDEIRRQG